MDGSEVATGLTADEVARRTADGKVNQAPEGTSRSVSQIVFANIFNPVNAIMLALFVLILIAGFPADGLFVGVVISNSVIGIAQELYARRELRKLELLNAPAARVRRGRGRYITTPPDRSSAGDKATGSRVGPRTFWAPGRRVRLRSDHPRAMIRTNRPRADFLC